MPASFRPPVRVAIVTLDNHLKGAVERADAELSAENIHLSLHAASDWDGDARALERTKSAVGEAHIVIATMLFLDDHIRTILPTLEARREQCDAMVGLMSAGEVVRLTRLGGYRMDAPARGPLALLKKLRRRAWRARCTRTWPSAPSSATRPTSASACAACRRTNWSR